jgi:RimJ/RimL family protein N-acetyltransferase
VTVHPFTLETERLVLDQLRESDAQAMYEYCQDPEFERFLTIPWPYTLADATWFITEHAPKGWSEGNDLIWAIRSREGEFLGVIGLLEKSGQFDVGFWIGRPHRGKGIIPEATTVVLEWALDPSQGRLTSITWECVVGNLASMLVARKLGFSYTGVAPRTLPSRDGTHPPSWHGVLRASDDRSVKPGWPLDSAHVENEGVSAP